MLRASLKSLFSRKLRLTLAIVAIVLGVSFLSGAFVLTDSLGARFERLFTSINQNVDVQVALNDDGQDEDPQPKLTQAQIDAMAALPGARSVSGDVSAIGVIPFDVEDGKPATTSGAPQIGGGVKGDDPFALVQLAEGSWPTADDQVVITRYTADQTHAANGDRLKIFLPEVNEAREFTITGIAVYDGDRDSLAGETLILFEEGFAQRTFYGQEGLFSGPCWPRATASPRSSCASRWRRSCRPGSRRRPASRRTRTRPTMCRRASPRSRRTSSARSRSWHCSSASS
ncbi:hypothetical protein Pflav_037790 [Phytohabitans flavus]|uniref:MacB-like periplasmic core domain-containing protein n=1 Tax=Phytohabitans flavus TaxID=1076124 RepID=A0A6F8XU95_9ACTN|nr:ABC transporter permease [Phytohabitans flavus]BCB77369.1 hypothetical protein Pflav_037790 [Phytohabitans flavus]